MRCSEVKGYLGPYLDSELDRDLTWRIVRHLDSCASCRDRFDREERVEAAIRDRLQVEVGDEEVVFERALDAALGRNRGPRVPRAVAGVLLALLVLAVGLPIVVDPFGPFSSVPDVFQNALADHRKYSRGALVPQPDSLSSAAAYLERELDVAVALPADEWDVEGARVCTFGESRVGYIMMKRGEKPVSVFVLPRDEEREESTETPCWSLGGDTHGVLRHAKGHDVCVVGDVDVKELERLAREVH